MATNKTRLFIFEPSGNLGPYQAVTEFDIYQEALDYAVTVVNVIRVTYSSAADQIAVFLFSYENPSFLYRWNGSALVRTEIVFPAPQP